ncbi:MAG: hypothetical protein ACI8TX_001588 [Hyphomicrobiaceae bacterium]|jgi:hypothetical protein
MKTGLFVVATIAIMATALPAAAVDPNCVITFQQNTPVPARSVSVLLHYRNAPGEFPGEAQFVECEIKSSQFGSAADTGSSRLLSLNAIGTPSAVPSGPRVLGECNWTPAGRFPVAGDFDLSVQSAFDTVIPFANPIAANVTISKI